MTTTCIARGPTAKYLNGTTLRTEMVFEDPTPADADNPWVDPDQVFLSIKRPISSPPVETLEYGVDVAVVKDSVGHYHALIDADENGDWAVRWEGVGTWPAVDEMKFIVRAGEFAP